MKVWHEVGSDMKVLFDEHDLDKLRMGYGCDRSVDEDGNYAPRVTVERDAALAEPTAQVSCRGEVSVQLPDNPYRVVLPLEIEAEGVEVDPYAYFGPHGRIMLHGEIEI